MHGCRTLSSERGTALIEFAILAPLLLLLLLGTVDVGLASLEHTELERLADQIADTTGTVGEANTIASSAGVVVACFQRSTSPNCYSDPFTTEERTQVVLSSTYDDPLILWTIDLRAEAVGQITP